MQHSRLSLQCLPLQLHHNGQEQNSNSNYWITSVYFLNESTGFLGTAVPLPINNNFYGGEIIRTTNSGVNWERVLLDSNLRVKSFYFLDQTTGFAVGGSFITFGKLMKTTNAGINWFTLLNNDPPEFYNHFYNIYFGNAFTGYISNYKGVYKTIDGGLTWTHNLAVNDFWQSELSLKRLHFFDVNTGIMLSDSGKIYKTTSAGSNWSISYVNHQTFFRDITFLNNTTGFTVGLEGKMYKTTNQSISWQQIILGTNESFYSIRFPNAVTGYITKDKGVLKTTDGGSVWQEIMQLNTDTLFSSYFINQEVGYVAGSKGRVFKTITGGVLGINQITSEIPSEYNLEQNYPNPFNPNTRIKFAIPKLANVRLAVYDMLGREVVALVNQQLTPGTYEVNWNAAKFSSGIYFYRLYSGEINLIKKMTLIK